MIVQSFQTEHGVDKYLILTADQLPTVVSENRDIVRSYMREHGSSWQGSTFEQFEQRVTTGDASLVEESEKMLRRLEDQIPMSRGWRNVDDVVGAVPNVPAFLAGHPQHMRRRERVSRDNAPLTVYMDLTSSGGISASNVRARGVTLLALVRVLVEHRPVELWVGASLGRQGVSGTTTWRIDTAPLDLARSAFHVSATAMSRGFGYAMCQHEMRTGGGWPFNDHGRHCRTAESRLAAVFPGTEILYVPPIYLTDPMTTDPVGWIKRVLKITTGDDE